MPMTPARKNKIKVIVFAAIVALCLGIYSLPQVRETITLEWVNAQFTIVDEALNRPLWGPVLYLVVAVVLIVVQIPGLIMVFVGAMVYDLWTAFALCWIASNIGTVATFLIARYFLHDYVAPRFAASRLAPLKSRIEEDGILMMCLLRLVLAMIPPVNWMVGATRIKVRDYVIGNALGLIPLILALQFATQQLTEIRSPRDVFQPSTVGVLLGMAVLLGVVMVVKNRLVKAPSGEPNS